MGNTSEVKLKSFKKIPIYVVEEHNDALQFIYSAIGGKKLPLESNTLLHLDAHPDMLIDRKLKGKEARAGKKILPLLQIENWIVPAAAAGHISRIVWLRPPWAKQFTDGTRSIHVGDHPDTGLLRVDSTEPYYMSDALYSARLQNKRKFDLTVAELDADDAIEQLIRDININQPYILDIDLDFFSTGNPFLNMYENIKLYDRLEQMFEFKMPSQGDTEELENIVQTRENQLDELEKLFLYLEKHNDLDHYDGEKGVTFNKVLELSQMIKDEAKRIGEPVDWWAVYAGGCTRDQGGLPHHISSEEEITHAVTKTLKQFLHSLPAPILVTVARSTEDGYCPRDQVEFIQTLVLQTLKEVLDTDEPTLYYLNESSSKCT